MAESVWDSRSGKFVAFWWENSNTVETKFGLQKIENLCL